MKEPLMKLLKPFIGTKDNKKKINDLLKEQIENNGVAVFLVGIDWDEDNKQFIYFKLLSGKPEVYNDKLLAIFISNGIYETIRVSASTGSGMEISADFGNYVNIYINYDMTLTDLLNCKVGDIVKYYIDDLFEKTIKYKRVMMYIKTDKSMPFGRIDIGALINPCSVVFVYPDNVGSSSEPIEYGYLKHLDKVNKFLYIYINKEVWKYSYQEDGRILKNFQFVEVVNS